MRLSGSKDNLLITVIFVAVLMVGSVSIYALSELNHTEDLHETERHYTVYGTRGGVECIGTGIAEYTPENSNYHVYSYFLNLGDAGMFSFGMIFLADDTPDPSLYVEAGSSEVEGKSVSVWKQTNEGVGYTFYISDFCTVEKAEIVSDSMNIVMTLSS